MTLQYIRDCKSFEELKPAIVFLCDKMQVLTWGEFNAYKRLIEIQTKNFGKTLKDLNEYAEKYQQEGVK